MTADWARFPPTCSSGWRRGSSTRCQASTGSPTTSRASRPAPSSGSDADRPRECPGPVAVDHPGELWTTLNERPRSCAGQGHPRRRREQRHDQEALRLHRRRVHRGQPARLPRDAVHRRGRRRLHQRRDPLRRDDPPEGRDGTPLVELLETQGIIPGIKVDTGAKPLAGAAGRDRHRGSRRAARAARRVPRLGARFAKWRATYTTPTTAARRVLLDVNAHALARYAALCQEAGIVPIVEPEVLMDGDAHDRRVAPVHHARARRRCTASCATST